MLPITSTSTTSRAASKPSSSSSLLLPPPALDALYSCLEVLAAALAELQIPFLLIAGSALGCVRSHSLLFCDDDIDIAIFECDYARLLRDLPPLLRGKASYKVRPFPAADRLRPRHCTQVWIDVFVLRRYECIDEIAAVVARKANGTPQPDMAASIINSINSCAPSWPLWHYDNRLALELWPREFLPASELFPLTPRRFGHLIMPTPRHSVSYLRRSYGSRCFEEYVLAVQHGPFLKETALRLAALGVGSGNGNGGGNDDVQSEKVGGWPRPLEPHHFTPIMHSKRPYRVGALAHDDDDDDHHHGTDEPAALTLEQGASHVRRCLLNEIATEDMWDGVCLDDAVDPSLWPTNAPEVMAAASTSTLSSSPSSSHLGATLAALTNYSAGSFVFDEVLLAAIEPHVAKARASRDAARATPSSRHFLPCPPSSLTTEGSGCYSTTIFPLAASLVRALGVGVGAAAVTTTHADLSVSAADSTEDVEAASISSILLSSLHSLLPGGKHAAAARLRDEKMRADFHRVFDDFVGKAVLTHLAEVAGSVVTHTGTRQTALVQSFPCLRLILPQEFSLGVHCDTHYGHSAEGINVVVPLSDGEQGCAALHAESCPGSEDWHPIANQGPGTFARFHGGQCLHFTSENHSTKTRVSLDFRVLWGASFSSGRSSGSVDCTVGGEKELPGDKYFRPGYYSEWQCGDGGEWMRIGALPAPDERVGYPFSGIRDTRGASVATKGAVKK